MLTVGAGEDGKVKFLQEAAINGQFKHPNVVTLLGVVTAGDPVCFCCMINILDRNTHFNILPRLIIRS